VGEVRDALSFRVNNKLSRRAGRGKKWLLKSMDMVGEKTTRINPDMDMDLIEIRARMEHLTLKMQ
jgi:hypothetical protein